MVSVYRMKRDGGNEDHWVTNNKSLTQDNQEAPAMFFDFVIVSLFH